MTCGAVAVVDMGVGEYHVFMMGCVIIGKTRGVREGSEVVGPCR